MFQEKLIELYGEDKSRNAHKITPPPVTFNSDNSDSFHLELIQRLHEISSMDKLRIFVNSLTTLVLNKAFIPHIYLLQMVANKAKYLKECEQPLYLNGSAGAGHDHKELLDFDEPRHVTAERMVNKLFSRVLIAATKKDIKSAEVLFKKMVYDLNIMPDAPAQSFLIKNVLSTGHPIVSHNRVKLLLQILLEKNISVTEYIYNELLLFYCKFSNIEDPLLFIQSMKEKDPPLYPTNVSYNILLFHFATRGNVEQVERIFSEMLANNLLPTQIDFLPLIIAYLERNDFDTAIQKFNMMQKEYNLTPNAKAYQLFIDHYCRVNNMEEALKWLRQMGTMADANAYETIISSYIEKRKDIKQAEDLFHKMQQLGIPPGRAHQTIIDNLAKLKQNNLE
jgi:pentatricopeptide repeat protein